MKRIIIDKPNDKQREFFKASKRYIAYGGARGGGKSWAVRKKAMLLALNYPGIRILIIRRTFPELRENHILPMLSELNGIAVYKETDKSFSFTGGSRIRFGYCDSESDTLQYQGQEYDVIFVDEATQFTYFQFTTLTACIRGVNAFPKRMYLTCNPGNVGHEWVKRLFIDRIYHNDEQSEDYIFIPARVYDNKALLSSNPAYVSMLKNLPEDLKRAWLDGDWNVFAGQYFTEFDYSQHVSEPCELPKHWRRYFTMDYGLDMLAGYFIAVDTYGKAYVYKELYKSGLIISEAAELIKANINEDICAFIAPPDLWNRRQDTGKSAARIFAECEIKLVKAVNNRVQGWYNLKEWLHIPAGEAPKLTIFTTCPNLIRTLPMLRHDSLNPNDCATEPHEITHAPDALRYWCAVRPRPAALHTLPDDSAPCLDSQINDFLNY